MLRTGCRKQNSVCWQRRILLSRLQKPRPNRTGLRPSCRQSVTNLSRTQQEIGRLQERLNEYDRIDAAIMRKDRDTGNTPEPLRDDGQSSRRPSPATVSRSSSSIQPSLACRRSPTTCCREFDHRWGIRMDTQFTTKSGTIQERFDIRVIDGTGEDDISAFSGGEKHLLRTIVRVALAMLQAERSGKALKVFIFDEAFDSLDYENARRLLAVFRHLEDLFNQVFIISHSDELLAEIPNRIHVSNRMISPRSPSMVAVSKSETTRNHNRTRAGPNRSGKSVLRCRDG